jgi:hypothetical protein
MGSETRVDLQAGCPLLLLNINLTWNMPQYINLSCQYTVPLQTFNLLSYCHMKMDKYVTVNRHMAPLNGL